MQRALFVATWIQVPHSYYDLNDQELKSISNGFVRVVYIMYTSVHIGISFWLMPMMLIYWEEAYTL